MEFHVTRKVRALLLIFGQIWEDWRNWGAPSQALLPSDEWLNLGTPKNHLPPSSNLKTVPNTNILAFIFLH